MARRPAKSSPSLYKLFDSAEIAQIREFGRSDDFANLREMIAPWLPEPDGDEGPTRERLAAMLHELSRDKLLPLDREAERVLRLASGNGPHALEGIVQANASADALATFKAQKDPLAKSLWAWLDRHELFEAAESALHVRLYRQYGRYYDAFEIDSESEVVALPEDQDMSALAAAVEAALDLGPGCTVTVFDLPTAADELPAIMLLIWHPQPVASVRDLRESGERRTIYFRPPGEGIIVYTPAARQIEVCADTIPVRNVLAHAFARTCLGLNLSAKPLNWRNYDLSRFLRSLSLDAPVVEGCRVLRAALTEIVVSPGLQRHRFTLKVPIDDDMDAIARRHLGDRNVFHRAAAIRRVEISVRHIPEGETDRRILSFSISDRNRCSLRSVASAEERVLGHRLLAHWGILQPLRVLSAVELRAVLGPLLELYDHPEDTVSGAWLEARGLDAARLVEGKYIQRKGLSDTLLEDHDELGTVELAITVSARRGHVHLATVDGQEAPGRAADEFELYGINQEWLEEILVKALADLRNKRERADRLHDNLLFLGKIDIGGISVPGYLARRLDHFAHAAALDAILRARSQLGFGLVLSAGPVVHRCLGTNVVVALSDHLMLDEAGPALCRESLALALQAGRADALGGESVRFETNGLSSGTLFIPGRPPKFVEGANRVKIIGRLATAFLKGAPAVATSDLVAGTGVHSPGPAFGKKWSEFRDINVRQAGKRSWELAT